ncbi:MAG: queuosine precursor transporter [Phycisphaerae bacterium]|nr:queuosine precursor transporter [Phycisphaerae bacterium]
MHERGRENRSPEDVAELPNTRHYKYYDLIMAVFVTVLLCSNLIGPGKTCGIRLPFSLPGIGDFLTFGAGNLFFPISYIFGDVLTEVYGYARTRKVIWAGFGAMIFATLMGLFVIHFPADPNEPFNKVIQPALEVVFGNTWRIVLGSICAFWAGDFVNSYVMAKMKIMTRGKALWTRTIGSTAVGQLVDSALFYPIAFAGVWAPDTMVKVIVFNWTFKVTVEVVFTPITYAIIGFLKRAEDEDYYDTKTNFTPFSLSD